MDDFLKRPAVVGMLCVPIAYMCFFAVVLWYLGPRLDTAAAAAIIGALAGGLAGVAGSALAGWFGSLHTAKESEDRIKSYASAQALELTKLDFELRRDAKALLHEEVMGEKKFLAPLKVHRTVYNAFFELYTKGTWQEEPEKLGLLNVITYAVKEESAEQAAEESEGQ